MSKKKQIKKSVKVPTIKPEEVVQAVEEFKTKVKAPKTSKKSIILEMLSSAEGASIKDLQTATGWQKHTVHGSLANLKKQMNLTIISEKVGAERVYKVAS